jgi:hypothetical protein
MGLLLLIVASLSATSCSSSGGGGSPAKDYWNGQSQEVKDFACEVGAETAAGVEWSPSMNFSLNELENAIAESC